MSRPKLSVCMIARDEEALLPGALESVTVLADEIIVAVDDRTTDRTESIARGYGARVRRFTWNDSFAEARNLSLDAARRDWILVIDADDRLTPLGHSIILEALRRQAGIDGYAFQIEELTLLGRSMAVQWTSVRLFPNQHSLRYMGRVHEQILRAGKPLKLVARVDGVAIRHVGYDPLLYVQRDKRTRNLELLQRELMDRPGHPYLLYQLALMYAAEDHELAVAYAGQALSVGAGLYPEQVADLEALCA